MQLGNRSPRSLRNKLSARRRRAAGRNRRLLFEQCESRCLLAEINLTSVIFIEKDNLSTSITPIIGEQVCVRANFNTTSLPAGTSYRIQFSLDSVPISASNVTSGAGLSSGSWYYYQCGWYASPGQHSVQVILDADNTVAETNETNNTLASPKLFTPVAPTTLPQKFLNPLGGVPFHDWRFSNYVDVDTTAGVKDFQGGTITYDGHDAHDIGVPNFTRMDAGIPEYAAADGIVEQMQDGNFDRNDTRGSRPANYVIINHGSGWRTIYYHLMTNTITVRVGDAVTAGQLLGLLGSSGDSNGPHLHFGITHYGNAIESEFSPADFYVSPYGYQGTQPTYVLDAVVTGFSPNDSDFDERPTEQTIFTTQTAQTPVLVFWFSSLPADEHLDLIEYRPDGTVNSTNSTLVIGPLNNGSYWWRPTTTGLSSNPGTWRFVISKGGVELASRSFVVTNAAGSPQIKVTQSGLDISDNRTTAVNFGTVAVGATAATQTFTINNFGAGLLFLSGLGLPPGFALRGSFPSTVAAGASASFTVELSTTRAGAKFGAIQFGTSDPDTPLFNFNVSGTVTGAVPAGAPVITLSGPALAYNGLKQALPIKPAATLTDADSANFAGGVLTAEFTSISSAADTLSVRNVGSAAGQIGVSGSTVTYGGVFIGSLAGGIDGTPLSISLNSAATVTAVQALLANVTFSTTATHPENLSRYVRLLLTDESGNLSNLPVAVVVQNLYPTTVSLDGNGNLLIADSSMAGKDDIWRLERSGDDLKLTDLTGNKIDVSSIPDAIGNLTSVVTIPFDAIGTSGQVLLDTRAGNDSLTIELSSGNPIPGGGIAVVGGDPTVGPGDKLIISGGDQGTVTYNYTNAHDGSVVMSQYGTVSYVGLEPIINTGMATDLIFNLPTGTTAVTLGDDGTTGNSLSRISATTIEKTDFANPSGSLTINRGSASDTLLINSLPDLTASLTVGTPALGFGSVTFAGPLTFAADKNLSVNSLGAIVLSNAASDLAVSGIGTVSLTAAQYISLASGANITAVDGAITLLANQQATPSSGDFAGIGVDGATVQSTGKGDITLKGRGGTASGGSQRGVRIASSGIVSGGTSGTVTIVGTGGTSSGDFNGGVRLAGTSSRITSQGANIVVMGFGGSGGLQIRGVSIEGGQIVAPASATVSVTGNGGATAGTDSQGILLTGANSLITSTNGDIILIGVGGGTGNATATGGVVATLGGSIRAIGTAKIQINGTAGNPTGSSYGVGLFSPSTISTNSGDVEITGVPVASAVAGITIAGALTVGTGGKVRLIADRLAISTGGTVTTVSQSATLLPNTAGVAIDLGGADTDTVLGISDSELDLITAPTIIIGDSTSGPILITGAISRSSVTALNLVSGAAISFTTGSLNTGGGNLLLAPSSQSNVVVASPATEVATGAGTLSFANGTTLAIQINGLTADTQYDQLNFTDNIDLTGVNLVLSGSYAPAIDDTFTIVNNNGSNPIGGQFNGLPDGKIFHVSSSPAIGDYVISYHGEDGNNVVITRVAAVPLLDSIANPDPLDEDSVAQLVQLTGIRPGYGHSLLNLAASSDNPALIPNPQIDYISNSPSAQLNFQPASGQFGTAVITVTIQDDGGASGRTDTVTQTFTVTVNPINDPPTFEHLVGNYSAPDENLVTHGPSSARSVSGWATNMSAGPANEANQKLKIKVENDKNSLFNVQPFVTLDGTLIYIPAPNAHGIANVSVTLQDDGGGNNASQATSFQIEIVKAHPLHNSRDSGSRNGLDVTGATTAQPDGFVTAGDVLAVINYINAKGSGGIANGTLPGPPYPDVNADDQVVAEDVLKIINYINANPNQSEASGLEISVQPVAASTEVAISADLMNLLAADTSLAQSKRRRLVN